MIFVRKILGTDVRIAIIALQIRYRLLHNVLSARLPIPLEDQPDFFCHPEKPFLHIVHIFIGCQLSRQHLVILLRQRFKTVLQRIPVGLHLPSDLHQCILSFLDRQLFELPDNLAVLRRKACPVTLPESLDQFF